ncbi:pyridoxamine 5'-phosphate oxidase family protein [Peribacillus sp. SCS-155]|uniref:pyridoxamine 5'-phosphate oxidase family protein n=1 Tax=Peribacillus sedimenti TaxID=3115297 RepID=UPI0039057E16
MNEQEIKNKISEVLDQNKAGVLATVKTNKPHARYMTFFHEDFNLYTPTSSDTHKVEDIKANPNVHVLIGYDGEGFGDAYLEVEGQVSIEDSESIKEKLWNEYLEKWFDGPHDPKYIILAIKPEYIRLMNSNGEPPQEMRL